MLETNLHMVDWARAQFALTAMYHWLFVPLTLGLSILCAVMESIYLKTGDEKWHAITRFWMTLFGINFAIGVATGLILEFEFGTNWSNYSWMVGDIFGAPLAIEGIAAFFLEATFFAVMFFGWNRVSKRFHLFATWMVAIGSNLSALWILVANAWMQHPVGMQFNPDTMRFEMQSFSEVIFSPVAVSKFTHTTTTSFVVSAFFVIAVSSWYLLKKRHLEVARRSILVASVFGLLGICLAIFTGDQSAVVNGETQPMKLAAYEGYYKGTHGAGLVAFGIYNHGKLPGDAQSPFLFEMKFPKGLSLLAEHELNAFVPGIDDLVWGNRAENIIGADEKIRRGRLAQRDLAEYREAVKQKDTVRAEKALVQFRENQDFLGYGYFTEPEETVPPVAATFYSFHVMVYLGGLFLLLLFVFLVLAVRNRLDDQKWLLRLGILTFFLTMIASQAGWVVAEVGRQPWAIQGMLPTFMGTTNIAAGHVKLTFCIFAVIFTCLLLAEIRIMLRQIQKGPVEA